jgi:hypothetical protein
MGVTVPCSIMLHLTLEVSKPLHTTAQRGVLVVHTTCNTSHVLCGCVVWCGDMSQHHDSTDLVLCRVVTSSDSTDLVLSRVVRSLIWWIPEHYTPLYCVSQRCPLDPHLCGVAFGGFGQVGDLVPPVLHLARRRMLGYCSYWVFATSTCSS